MMSTTATPGCRNGCMKLLIMYRRANMLPVQRNFLLNPPSLKIRDFKVSKMAAHLQRKDLWFQIDAYHRNSDSTPITTIAKDLGHHFASKVIVKDIGILQWFILQDTDQEVTCFRRDCKFENTLAACALSALFSLVYRFPHRSNLPYTTFATCPTLEQKVR